MKSIVIRSAAVFAVVVLAVLGLFSGAQAQDGYNPYNPYNPTNPTAAPGSPALPYEGPFTIDNPVIDSGALGFGGLNPSIAVTDDGGTGGGLAVTGSSANLPVAIAMGLIAAGGTAAVSARKRDDD